MQGSVSPESSRFGAPEPRPVKTSTFPPLGIFTSNFPHLSHNREGLFFRSYVATSSCFSSCRSPTLAIKQLDPPRPSPLLWAPGSRRFPEEPGDGNTNCLQHLELAGAGLTCLAKEFPTCTAGGCTGTSSGSFFAAIGQFLTFTTSSKALQSSVLLSRPSASLGSGLTSSCPFPLAGFRLYGEHLLPAL